jgi:hypothetical protein
MSAEYDFLAQILQRVIREPSVGARLATDVLAVADSVGAGVSGRAMLATLGQAQVGPAGALAIAETESFVRGVLLV